MYDSSEGNEHLAKTSAETVFNMRKHIRAHAHQLPIHFPEMTDVRFQLLTFYYLLINQDLDILAIEK